MALEEFLQKYPDRKLMLVDQLVASSGFGKLSDMAADLRNQGSLIEEVRNQVEQKKLNVHNWLFSTDLTHYQLGGAYLAY